MIYRADDETKRKFGYTSNVLMERETLPEIKINRAFDFFKQRLADIFKIFTGNQIKLERKYQVFSTISEFVPIFAVFIFSMFVANQLIAGIISTGTLWSKFSVDRRKRSRKNDISKTPSPNVRSFRRSNFSKWH